MMIPPERLIDGPACVAEGAEWLAAHDARFAVVLAQVGPLPLRRYGQGFPALLDAILGQQVSTSSAAAVRARLEAAGIFHEDGIAAASDEALRGCGLSRQKIRYARALAEARLDYPALRGLSSQDVIATLLALPGIGSWTAEIYAMFSLGRADVFAPGDLALQEAARRIFDLPARPKEREFRVMAEAWSPWRSVAARLLWSYYLMDTTREGIR